MIAFLKDLDDSGLLRGHSNFQQLSVKFEVPIENGKEVEHDNTTDGYSTF